MKLSFLPNFELMFIIATILLYLKCFVCVFSELTCAKSTGSQDTHKIKLWRLHNSLRQRPQGVLAFNIKIYCNIKIWLHGKKEILIMGYK